MPRAKFLEQPIKGLFGTADGITHRSGFETGIQLDLMLDPSGVLGLWAGATAIVMPDDVGPQFTGLIELGVSFNAGPR
jgi:hypothetical protein